MNKFYALTFFLFACLKLAAQDYGNLHTTLQGLNEMQNTSVEIVPNAQFPFGQPLKQVKQQDRSPKKVFVLGVYASAVHAKWRSPEGKVLCETLAVASEPEIFWKGENAAEVISNVIVPSEAGYLEPAEEIFNGTSGRVLDELYLAPLGLSRSDAWLCDLVPHSFMNPNQSKAIKRCYAPLCKKYNLPAATVPAKPRRLTDENRRSEILAELAESQAETIILLGDDPIKWFLSFVSDCKKTRLGEFDRASYGSPLQVNISGRMYSVILFVHVRQGGGIGTHDANWERLHNDWVKNMNK